MYWFGAGDWTQDPAHAKHSLYHFPTSPNPSIQSSKFLPYKQWESATVCETNFLLQKFSMGNLLGSHGEWHRGFKHRSDSSVHFLALLTVPGGTLIRCCQQLVTGEIGSGFRKRLSKWIAPYIHLEIHSGISFSLEPNVSPEVSRFPQTERSQQQC